MLSNPSSSDVVAVVRCNFWEEEKWYLDHNHWGKGQKTQAVAQSGPLVLSSVQTIGPSEL